MANTLRIRQCCSEKQHDDSTRGKGTSVNSQSLAEGGKKAPNSHNISLRVPAKELSERDFIFSLGKIDQMKSLRHSSNAQMFPANRWLRPLPLKSFNSYTSRGIYGTIFVFWTTTLQQEIEKSLIYKNIEAFLFQDFLLADVTVSLSSCYFVSFSIWYFVCWENICIFLDFRLKLSAFFLKGKNSLEHCNFLRNQVLLC